MTEAIAAYATQQQQIIDAIRKRGGQIHQNDFDNDFSQIPFGPLITSEDTALLHPDDPWVNLLLLMVRFEIITQSGTAPNLLYSL